MMAFEQNQQLQRLVGNNAYDQLGVQPRYNNQMNPYQMSHLQQPQQINFRPINQSGGGFLERAGNFLGGTSPQQATYSNYTPFQQQGFQSLLNAGNYNMQNPYEGFEPLQQHLLDYFNEQIVPRIAERFTSMGGGALSSPAFAQQLSAGGKGLASQLLQHKLDYGRQNREFGLRQSQIGLTPQYEQSFVPGQEGFLSGLANRAIPAAANLLGGRFF